MHLFDFVHFVVIDYFQYCNWLDGENIWLGVSGNSFQSRLVDDAECCEF